MRWYGFLAQGLSSYLSIFHFKGFLISALHIICKIWKMRFGFRTPLGNWSHFSLQKHPMIKVNAEGLVTLRQHDGQLLEFLSLTYKWFIFRLKAWQASPWPEQERNAKVNSASSLLACWRTLFYFFGCLEEFEIQDLPRSMPLLSLSHSYGTCGAPKCWAVIFYPIAKHFNRVFFHSHNYCSLIGNIQFVIPVILQTHHIKILI